MSSGGKGGANNQSKLIYGSGVIALGWGPWDWISAVIHNGNFLFQGDLPLTTDVTDLTGAIADPSYIAPGGSLKLYRGTETQPADFTGRFHKGTAKLECINIFFGQDNGTAPNLQVIGGGLPRVPTSIVASGDNIADDGQVNLVAALAEILLDERGADFPLALMDAPSWLASGHWCAQDQEHRDYAFISPLITEQAELRKLANELLDPVHGFCRWTKDGKLACCIYEWGSDPGGLPVLDARHFTRRANIPLGDWEDVKTELVVSFTDRDYQFQGNTVIVPNSRAAQIRQLVDQGQLDRKHVMRMPQAYRHGNEHNRRQGSAPSTAMLSVRRPILDVLGLLIGDKIKIDTDPEPGGAGLAQLCRIERIKRDRSDEAQITVVTDNLVPATAYIPDFTPPTPVDEDSPPLEHYLGVPLPPNAFGWPPAVALLATRPAAKILGFEAYFSTASAGAYADLGQQPGFAVRATLHANIAAVDTTAAFTETDGLSGADASLAAHTPGGNTTEAGDNVLLALIAQLDGNGRIALGADGDPIMEFVSIVDRATGGGLPAATFNYTLLRGRMGTKAQAWTAAGCVVWIVPRANVVPWRHTLLSSMLGSVAYFRMVSFTPQAVDDSLPVPELSVNMLPANAPMYAGNIDADTSPDDGPAPNPVSGVTILGALNLIVLRYTPPTNVPLRRIFIYESSTGSPPLLPQFALDPAQTALFRDGLPAATTLNYWIEVQGKNGKRTRSGPYTATTRAGIDLSDIVPGMEMVGVALTVLPNPVGYTGPKNVLLVTDKKLYRYNATVPAWTNEVDGADIKLNSIIVGMLAAGAVTAYAIGSNLVITTTANVGTAVINDAAIVSLSAGKISAGILDAMTLTAANTASDSVVFNRGFGTGSTMPAFAALAGDDPSNNHYINATTEFIVLGTVYGWATGSGFATDRFSKPDMVFMAGFYSVWTIAALGAGLSHADMYGVWRVNGGSWNRMTTQTRIIDQGNPAASVFGIASISGLSGTDVIEFGVELVTPANQFYNYSNLSLSWGNL
jgi:hypothetical protein